MVNAWARRTAAAGLLVALCLVLLSGCFLFPNRPPVASFVIHYNTTEDPLLVEVDASLSSDPDEDAIVSYMWAFLTMDPEGPAVVEPLAFSAVRSAPVLLLRYPAEDVSQIQLVVVDERGAASEPVTQTVVVPNLPVEPTL